MAGMFSLCNIFFNNLSSPLQALLMIKSYLSLSGSMSMRLYRMFEMFDVGGWLTKEIN